MSLQKWLEYGWLHSHKSSRKEISDLLRIIDRDLQDAAGDISADWRFGIAYNAALRVVTAYSAIEDIDVERELRRNRRAGESSPLTDMIVSAVRIASDFLVPDGLDSGIWKRLLPEERFYIKGVEIEAHGEYRDGVYQEFARGFGIRDYRGLIGSGAANQTRLKTPDEFKGRDLSGAELSFPEAFRGDDALEKGHRGGPSPAGDR